MKRNFAVILSGGAGARLWPVSRFDEPKQFQTFTDSLSLLSHTVKRADALASIHEIVVVCSATHQSMVYQHTFPYTRKPTTFLLEPIARNTAAAITCAAVHLENQYPSDELCMLVLPSDHLISDLDLFEQAVGHALKGAQAGHLVTFGVVATKPETGYGYIEVGEALPPLNVCKAVQFVEKPNLQHAQDMLSTGRYRWNSGMFLMPTSLFMQEVQRYAAPVAQACTLAVNQSIRQNSLIHLDKNQLTKCPSISIDHAVFEHSNKVAVVSLNAPWTDLGSWAAVADIQEKNLLQGAENSEVIEIDAKQNYVRAHKTVAIIGIDNIVVVDTPDALLISHRDSTQSVKDIVSSLNMQNSPLATSHALTPSIAGSSVSVETGQQHQIQHLFLQPGKQLPLQSHTRYTQHLLVVSGIATLTTDSTTVHYVTGQHIAPRQGLLHRIENQEQTPLSVLEVLIREPQNEHPTDNPNERVSAAALSPSTITTT